MQPTQAILPVAGLGTRFLPWTKIVPKELLPIGNKPMIALLVDECVSVGITDICFVISRGKEGIPLFFEQDDVLEAELMKRGKDDLIKTLHEYDGVQFHIACQEEQLGDGHAILQAAEWVTGESVAVLFGDDLIGGKRNGLQQLCEAYEKVTANGEPAAMLCLEDVPRERVSKYGIADVEETDGRLKTVKGLVEKPAPEEAPSTLGVVGKYILPSSILDTLRHTKGGKGGEIRVIDALISQIGTLPVFGLQVEGKRYDTGTPQGYREAVMDLG